MSRERVLGALALLWALALGAWAVLGAQGQSVSETGSPTTPELMPATKSDAGRGAKAKVQALEAPMKPEAPPVMPATKFGPITPLSPPPAQEDVPQQAPRRAPPPTDAQRPPPVMPATKSGVLGAMRQGRIPQGVFGEPTEDGADPTLTGDAPGPSEDEE